MEKIYKLLSSGNEDDFRIGLEYLLAYSEKEILRFFKTYSSELGEGGDFIDLQKSVPPEYLKGNYYLKVGSEWGLLFVRPRLRLRRLASKGASSGHKRVKKEDLWNYLKT